MPLSSPTVNSVSSPRRKGLVLIALSCIALVIFGVFAWSGDERPEAAPAAPRAALLDVLDGPGGSERVQIDVTLYAPADTPAPAVLLAHGFGGSKDDTAAQAQELVRRGFTVLTYSSRGFGRSTGRIALNAPEYEVADARQLLDWLARQPEVLRDGEGDPRVGVTGGSYGGALSLLLAGTDPRVDAIAPVMTYNDLAQALLPNTATRDELPADTPAAGAPADQGVFKQAWAGLLFSAGTAPREHGRTAVGVDGPSGTRPGEQPLTCGNFTPQVCAAYTEVAQTGRAGQATLDLLEAVSPKRVTGNIRVPTLLVQGERDTLFGLEQADANARQIAAAGGKVKVIWFAGGHDGEPPGPALRERIADWFAFHLGGVPPVPDPGTGFEYDVAGQQQRNGRTPVRTVAAPAYPGVGAERAPRFALPLHGAATQVVNPPGGSPASTSSLPGAGAVLDAAGRFGQSLARDLPGQVAVFRTDPLDSQLLVSGSPQVRLSVASVPGQPTTGDAVLFAKLYDLGPDGQRRLLGNAVSPIHVVNLPPDGTPVEVEVALPGVVHPLETGHRLELAVTTTDQAYAVPKEPAVHLVGLAGGGAISVPSVRGTTGGAATVPVAPLVGIGVIAAFALLAWLLSLILRKHTDDVDPLLAETPLVIAGLGKSYPDRGTAVQDLSIRVERGQIVGLLGPNGAGKTTTLRMLMGLLHPTAGQIRVFGHRLLPGAPVLSRVGSLVESPGFLPHLSGLDNLRYYWAATGRPMLQARFDEVLQIAGLGTAAQRRVRTYSQGMKQRLAIAQAMLGLPELLVLDEPTNGLGPPQIHQMREILRRYAATGRSVLISSHLLAEVEQTCTHVVVMHEGRLVAAGSVADIVSVDGEATFRVDEPEKAAEALRTIEGLGVVETDGDLVHADLAGHSAAVAVNVLVASGISVHQVGPRRRLEDAFLQLVGEEAR
ncbi:ABC transporter ATP-binding protein [Saccharopolyspora subtropica]|uniref:ABC transporter ATP-binding protein n=1 Tax=Saccharopolyspora thermophila TaxID=89367 RepID=A0A917K418_9PSEU|nr:ABC transporter ATP-binding protein [Saccharopolyspora subtropica]